MYIVTGSSKEGQRIRRHRQSFSLLRALREALPQGPPTAAGRQRMWDDLEGKMETCLQGGATYREGVASDLFHLMRSRDILRYLGEVPEEAGLRHAVLRAVLDMPAAAERWSRIKAMLVEELRRGGAPTQDWPGLRCRLSRRNSDLGRLLQAVALFNFDEDPEQPPPHLTVHFAAGHFPDHEWRWDPSVVVTNRPAAWVPAAPLCRWEYLAADLLLDLQAARQTPTAAGMSPAQASPPPPLPAATAPHGAAPACEGRLTALYCRAMRDGDGDGHEQVELLPLQPAALLPELQRQVHRRWGAEGLRLFFLLMERLVAQPAGEPVSLEPGQLVRIAGEGGVSRAVLRARAAKLERIVTLLAEQEVHRVFTAEGRDWMETAPLLAVLARRGSLAGSGIGAGAAQSPAPPALRLRVLADPLLVGPQEAPAASRRFQELPLPLLRLSPREHPLALGLYVYVRGVWQVAQGRADATSQTARQLFEDAGFWLKPASRYRMLEQLKTELRFLQEQGFIGAWRIQRGTRRDMLQERYRIEPPAESGATEAPLRHLA